MRNKIKAFIGAILLALGFNTIDVMIWSFRWNQFWHTTQSWDMGPFWLHQWWAYFLFGIIPFGLGFYLIGTLKEVE